MVAQLLDERMEKFGDVLRRLRKRKRWTQSELAAAAGLSLSSVQKTEAADDVRLHDANFRRLANAFELTPDALEQLWKGEVVQVTIPREAYDEAAADAEKAKLPVEEFIARKLGPKTTAAFKKTGAGKGAAGSKDTLPAESHQ